MTPPGPLSRRTFVALTACAAAAGVRSAEGQRQIRFALTPVLLTSDLDLVDRLKAYLELATGRAVQLVTRRTYQEITTLLVSGQVDAAWICGYPFVAYQSELALIAVPIWRGKPLYQSYLITDSARTAAGSVDDLRQDIHAFSDPTISNSGYLVTASELARNRLKPEQFFRKIIFTYGHANVVRAVASGLVQSGSVDGYVYEVLKEVDPTLTRATRLVRASKWYAFPPVACQASALHSENTNMLQQALLQMHTEAAGKEVLAMLRLDRFTEEPASLFDSIAANMNLVRDLG